MRKKEKPVMWAVDSTLLSKDRYRLKVRMPETYKRGWRWLEFASH